MSLSTLAVLLALSSPVQAKEPAPSRPVWDIAGCRKALSTPPTAAGVCALTFEAQHSTASRPPS